MLECCTGCGKQIGYTLPLGKTVGFASIVCSVYKEPQKLHWARNSKPCPFNPPKVEDQKKSKLNPIKASKRRR